MPRSEELDQVSVPMTAKAWNILRDAAEAAGFVNRRGRVVLVAFVRQVLAESPRVQMVAAEKHDLTPEQVVEEFMSLHPGRPKERSNDVPEA